MDPNTLTVVELKAEARTRGIVGFSKMDKNQLIQALSSNTTITGYQQGIPNVGSSVNKLLKNRRNIITQ